METFKSQYTGKEIENKLNEQTIFSDFDINKFDNLVETPSDKLEKNYDWANFPILTDADIIKLIDQIQQTNAKQIIFSLPTENPLNIISNLNFGIVESPTDNIKYVEYISMELLLPVLVVIKVIFLIDRIHTGSIRYIKYFKRPKDY